MRTTLEWNRAIIMKTLGGNVNVGEGWIVEQAW
jgi:hypothetical protein